MGAAKAGLLNLTETLKVPDSDVVVFKYSDYGIDLYGNAVLARVDWLRRNEDAVRRFLVALTEGLRFALRDPRAAIAHIKAAEPLVQETTELKRLRLAIGARRRDVLRQFLLEAALLSGAGGLAGVLLASALGLLAARLAPTFPATPPVWAVVAGLATSVFIGILAGYWPARRAAALDPVEALRYE